MKALLIRYFAKDIASLLGLFRTLLTELDAFVDKENARAAELQVEIEALAAEQEAASRNAALAANLKTNIGSITK